MMVLVTSAVVKPNADQAFAEQFERQLFPSLQAQPGFKGELLLVSPGAPEVILITFWNSDANARSYERSVWAESTKTLANILNPAVFRRFQLAHSTLHQEGVAAFPMQSPITTEPTGVGA
jgi:heme-degrading monooxygenase HmoA